MKIKAKLNIAIYSIVLGFAITLAVSFFVTYSTDLLRDLELQSERVVRYMYGLTDSTKSMILSSSADLESLKKDWDHAHDMFTQSIDDLEKHPGTRFFDEELREEISMTKAVWALNSGQLEGPSLDIDMIIAYPKIPDEHKKGLRYITEYGQKSGLQDGQFFFTLITTQDKLERIDIMSRVFVVNNLVVLEDTIRKQVYSIKRNGQWIAMLLALVVTVYTVIFVTLFSKGLSSRVEKIEDIMRSVAERDLTVRTAMPLNDEIGYLASHINKVLDTLSGFFLDVRDTVRKMDLLKESLSSGSAESASAVDEITKNISSIRNRFINLDRNVASTTNALKGIVAEIHELTERINEQTQSIEESSAAIEQMTASISSVATLSIERKNRAENLVKVIDDGGEKVSLTNDLIKSIAKEIEDILEIIEIINKVSEQTNLLSMNAAIESAHAGDAGKGFAVVADEIKKLAESTTENSTRIDSSLKSIAAKISNAMVSSDSSHSAFSEINSEVRLFAQALDEIAVNMDELSKSSSDVMRTSSSISGITQQIQRAANTMNDGTREIQKAAEETRDISHEVVNGMDEIEKGSGEILAATVELMKLTESTGEQTEYIRDQVELFRTPE